VQGWGMEPGKLFFNKKFENINAPQKRMAYILRSSSFSAFVDRALKSKMSNFWVFALNGDTLNRSQ